MMYFIERGVCGLPYDVFAMCFMYFTSDWADPSTVKNIEKHCYELQSSLVVAPKLKIESNQQIQRIFLIIVNSPLHTRPFTPYIRVARVKHTPHPSKIDFTVGHTIGNLNIPRLRAGFAERSNVFSRGGRAFTRHTVAVVEIASPSGLDPMRSKYPL